MCKPRKAGGARLQAQLSIGVLRWQVPLEAHRGPKRPDIQPDALPILDVPRSDAPMLYTGGWPPCPVVMCAAPRFVLSPLGT